MSLFTFWQRRKTRTSNPSREDVDRYLRSLVRCKQEVMIASPSYRDSCYKCDVIVSASDVNSWAKKHTSGYIGSSLEYQLARVVLPLWTNKVESAGVSLMDIHMQGVIRDWIQDFIGLPQTRVFCYECGEDVEKVETGLDTLRSVVDHYQVHGHWSCQNNHNLYSEKYSISLHRTRSN